MSKEKKEKSEKKEKKKRFKRVPTLFESISTIIMIMIFFGIGSFLNLNYVPVMIVVGGYTALIGWRCGYTWKEMEAAVSDRVKKAMPVLVVLIAVGALVSSLMFSGTLPMIIYYGLQIVSPRWIVLCSFLMCALFSIITGTSNGSASTAGLAMTGLALSMENVNLGMVAGACYAGSIFGDKLSPLSDTTIMAAMVTDNDVFDHIKHLFKTVGPAAGISIIIYIVYGFMQPPAPEVVSETTVAMLDSLNNMFEFNIILLVPIVFLLWGSFSKKPTSLVLFGTSFIAVAIGVLYQGFSFQDGVNGMYEGFKCSYVLNAHPNFDISSMSEQAATLLNRGGIASMAKSFIVCFLAMYFAGIAELIGMLKVLLDRLLVFVKGTGSLILVTGISTMILTVVGSSSTVGIIVGGEMFKEKYKEMGLHSLNLARTLDDFGTGSTGFFPWTYSGMLYASVLSASTLTFLRYSYMSWLVWIFAIFYGFTGIGIKKLNDKDVEAAV